jgi:competence protein ComEA
MKQRIKNHLSLTKKEWNGMVMLVVLIGLVLALPYVYQLLRKDTVINPNDFNKAVALLGNAKTDSSLAQISGNKTPTLFYFDPNTITAAQWQQLGLSGNQTKIIQNYLAKGGHFYKNTDLQKIYTMTPADYQRLGPYIDIPGDQQQFAPKLKPGATVELNSADSAQFTQVKGIGPSFAMRIIRYRGRLGGFLQKEQLKEVYGVDSAKYLEIQGQLMLNPALISRLNINTISFESLRQFPYLSYKQASAIIQYRVQHGNYHSINDLKNIAIITPADLQKIEPYLIYK